MKNFIKNAIALSLAAGFSLSLLEFGNGTLVGAKSNIAPEIKQVVTTEPRAISADQYKYLHLVWDNEFTGNKLPDGWEVFDTSKVYNGELEYYTPNNVAVNNGMLTITAERQNYKGHYYTSGAVEVSQNYPFGEGRIDIKAKLPTGSNIVNAFWLRPVNSSVYPEIDILEYLQSYQNRLYNTIHYEVGKKRFAKSSGYQIPNVSNCWHTFSIVRHAGTIVWLVDNKITMKIPDYSNGTLMRLEINTSIGGWARNPNPKKPFPTTKLEIQSVKYYMYIDGDRDPLFG